MSDLQLPAEWLLEKGWRKTHPDAHPQETTWKLGNLEMDFLDAYLEQIRIEKSKESETK